MSAFQGTSNYIASNELQLAVNAAIALERPLLIKGETKQAKENFLEIDFRFFIPLGLGIATSIILFSRS